MNDFMEFCRFMHQENITERKGINDFSYVSFEEYYKNNFNYLIQRFWKEQVQAV